MSCKKVLKTQEVKGNLKYPFCKKCFKEIWGTEEEYCACFRLSKKMLSQKA